MNNGILKLQTPVYGVGPAETKDAPRVNYPLVFALFLVILAATVHNFAGVGAALFMSLLFGNFLRGKFNVNALFFATMLIAIFISLRILFPANMALQPQVEEAARFLSYAILISTISRMNASELGLVVTSFIVTLLLLYPSYLALGLFGIQDASGNSRFASLMPHANHLGYVAASTSIAFVYLWFIQHKHVKFIGLTILASITLVLLSESSGAIAVLGAGVLTLPFTLKPTLKRFVMIVVGAMLAVVLVASPVGQALISKFMSVEFNQVFNKSYSLNFGNQGSSLAWRLSYWLAIFNAQMASDTLTIILGQGGGAGATGGRVFFFMSHDPHSDFVKVFLEFGVLGWLIIFSSLTLAVLSTGTFLLGSVVLFGPMLTGNSLASPSVMFILLINLLILFKIRKEKKYGSTNLPINATPQ